MLESLDGDINQVTDRYVKTTDKWPTNTEKERFVTLKIRLDRQ